MSVVAHLASAGADIIGEPMVRYGARGYGPRSTVVIPKATSSS
jgi:hypothetical protein